MGKFSLKLLPDEPGYPEENPASVAYVNRKLRWTQSECNESMDTIEKALDSKADLGDDGKVLESQLPLIGDNVKAYDSKESFPEEGTVNIIYIDATTDKIYRWDTEKGEYIEVSAGTIVSLDKDSNKITVGSDSIEVAPKSHVDDMKNPHKVTAGQVGAYTKDEVNDKLNDKLNSTAISDWAKADEKPSYTASEVGVTLKEENKKYTITIGKESVTPVTTESDPVFTGWKDGTSVALGANATAEEYYGYKNDNYVVVGASAVVCDSETTALGYKAEATEGSSTALGANSVANGNSSTALGANAYTDQAYTLGLAYTPEQILLGSTTEDNGASAETLQSYLDAKADKTELDEYAKADDVRGKTDLAVYSKYVKWYIIETSGDGVLAEPIEMYDYGGYTFECNSVNVSGDTLHPNKIVCDTRYGEDGKVSGVSGSGRAYYSPTGEYTTVDVAMDTSAAEMINDPANGEFSAIVNYFDADGNTQQGMVRFRVTYTGATWKPGSTLVKTSELASKETDPKWAAWKDGTSVALGANSVASGSPSTALGDGASASGTSSTALGDGASASGTSSTALGNGASANGNSSTALGANSVASGSPSTALGYSSTASGSSSTALGYFSTASGSSSTALGYFSTASGSSSTALGYNSYTAKDNTLGIAYTPEQIWLGSTKNDKGVTAKTLQSYLDEEIDPVFTAWKGDYNIALGYSASTSTDTGNNNTAIGASSEASGGASTAIGASSKAKKIEGETAEDDDGARQSTAVGYGSTASGFRSTAVGSGAYAKGKMSLALGAGAKTTGDYATAIKGTAASYSLAVRGTASGDTSMAFGGVASGEFSITLGAARATGRYSMALGVNSVASGSPSTALGYNSYTAKDNTLGLAYTPEQILLGSTTEDNGATAKTLQSYLDAKADKDDVRDKLDLSVYSKYTEWYIINDGGDVLAKMEGDGQTFTCDVEVYSGQEHPNKITVYVGYDTTTGKVNIVKGEAQTWYPLSVGDQPPAYTTSELLMDSDAVSQINDPTNGGFGAVSYYFDENGQQQSGIVRFKVEYTGARQKLDDTLAKTSDLTFANIKSSSYAAPTLANGLGYISSDEEEETVYMNGKVNYYTNSQSADFKFPDPSTLEGSSDNSYTLAVTANLDSYRKLTDNKIYDDSGLDTGKTYVTSDTFSALAAKVDTANATLEEVV